MNLNDPAWSIIVVEEERNHEKNHPIIAPLQAQIMTKSTALSAIRPAELRKEMVRRKIATSSVAIIAPISMLVILSKSIISDLYKVF
jgi:hypothetical protein